MARLTLSELHPWDRVFRNVVVGYDRGCDITEPQPLTIVRVNRKTATVRTDEGSVFRIEPHEIVGRWTED